MAEKNDLDVKLLQELIQKDPIYYKKTRSLILAFISVVIIFIVSVGGVWYSTQYLIRKLEKEYISNTNSIIKTKTKIELANQWERLPVNLRKERLREQYYKIIRYYTNLEQNRNKMNDDELLDTFNTLWDCTNRLKYINFFLPLAYMKVVTNYNPVYNKNYKHGIAAMYTKMGERISNLPLVRNDPTFQTVYKGVITLNNPREAIKLLIARIDDLMTTFNNRVDWVILAMLENEYSVIEKYWDGGKGKIPDKYYKSGQLAEILKYYYAFTNWEIPGISYADKAGD